MVFDDLVHDEAFDVWIADEAWDVDHFLHENPERKCAPLAWLTDFVGFLPMPAGGEREAFVAADHNTEMIEHIERFPSVRDRAIFVGEPGDIVGARFGPELPLIREWTEGHYDFAGYIPGFEPGATVDRAALGYGDEPLCIVSVGGSGVGAPLLQRALEALPIARERIPDLRTLVVTGPRIDPTSIQRTDGVEVVGYVHELWRHLAVCDVAVVQGGLTTAMELVAAGRPFVSIPLASHFEQQFHVRHRLDRYGARTSLQFADASPDRLGALIADLVGTEPAYLPVAGGGAGRAADLIAELLG
jgi:predicted glycosyltransferase